MSIVVIGTTFVDIKGFPAGKYNPHGRNLGDVITVHGGVGRNVAENFANVGMSVSYCGMLEDTAFGRDVERHLKNIGVNLDHMNFHAGAAPAQIGMKTGRRKIARFLVK